MDSTGNLGSLVTTILTGSVAASTSLQVTRAITDDTALLACALAGIGIVVGLGHSLASRNPMPVRRIIGKMLMSVGVSLTAAATYYFQPTADPLVVMAVGAGLSVMGSGFLEEIVRKRFGVSQDKPKE